MTTAEKIGVLARKLAAQRQAELAAPDQPMVDFAMPLASVGDPVARAWRISLARAARDTMRLAIGFEDLSVDHVGLVEVLEYPMERALILIIEGAGEALGLMVISAPILSGMIEMLTLSRLAADASDAPRSPTRTDAAMVVDTIDAALAAFAQSMFEQGNAIWAEPYRYAAFIEDPRPLHLMLEDGDYHLLRARVDLEHGARQGDILVALPDKPVVQIDFAAPSLDDAMVGQNFDLPDEFSADFSAQIAAMPAHLDAVLAQVTLPLDRVLRLQIGEVLDLGAAGLDQIQLLGIDGQTLGGGKLGQNRGMRAVRLDIPDAALRPKQTEEVTALTPHLAPSDDIQTTFGEGPDLLQVG